MAANHETQGWDVAVQDTDSEIDSLMSSFSFTGNSFQYIPLQHGQQQPSLADSFLAREDAPPCEHR